MLRKLGVTAFVKERFLIPKFLIPQLHHHLFGREMQFPSFSGNLHASIRLHVDYFRYATMGLAVQRVLSEDIEGSLAEVGVHQGHMSRFVYQVAPDRVYYLFDTFTGFSKQDFEPDASEDNRFRDTSVEMVLARIGETKNIVIKKGHVPDTLKGLEEEKFALVLLDLDLYKPTVSSLEFFYPRITKGGYLVVHDYNNEESNWACKRAVDGFMQDKPEKIIEIADLWGTVLFRKL